MICYTPPPPKEYVLLYFKFIAESVFGLVMVMSLSLRSHSAKEPGISSGFATKEVL